MAYTFIPQLDSVLGRAADYIRELRGRFHASTGHYHDGTAGEGPQVVKAGTATAATQTVTDSAADFISTTPTLLAGTLTVIASIQFQCSAWTVANDLHVLLLVNGEQKDDKFHMIDVVWRAGTLVAMWNGSVSAGAQTIKIQVYKTTGDNTISVRADSELAWINNR